MDDADQADCVRAGTQDRLLFPRVLAKAPQGLLPQGLLTHTAATMVAEAGGALDYFTAPRRFPNLLIFAFWHAYTEASAEMATATTAATSGYFVPPLVWKALRPGLGIGGSQA